MDWLFALLAIVLVCVVVVVIVVVASPVLLWEAFIWLRVARSGASVKHIRIRDGLRAEYIERGDHVTSTGTILLVHGFASSKDTFGTLISSFPKHYRVIAVDLPGHGGTRQTGASSLAVPAMIEFLREFCEAMGLTTQPLHLVSASLGGYVGGLLAARHPDLVSTLTLLSPAGVRPVKASLIETAFDLTGKMILMPQTTDDIRHLITLNSFNQPLFVPEIFLKGILQDRKKRSGAHETILRSLKDHKVRYMLEDELDKIKAPTLVAWGRDDKVIDVSTAEVFRKRLPHCETILLDKCGHDIALDCRHQLTEALTSFIAKHT